MSRSATSPEVFAALAQVIDLPRHASSLELRLAVGKVAELRVTTDVLMAGGPRAEARIETTTKRYRLVEIEETHSGAPT